LAKISGFAGRVALAREARNANRKHGLTPRSPDLTSRCPDPAMPGSRPLDVYQVIFYGDIVS
jgi:hypothetical protein